MKKIIKSLLIFLVGFFIIGTILGAIGSRNKKVEVNDNTEKETISENISVSSTPISNIEPTSEIQITRLPKPTDKPASISIKVTEKINNIISEKYTGFEITIWNKNSDLASEGQTPYEVVLNGSFNKPVVSSCDQAKKTSYYILETLYKDEEIKPTLSRILITIPSYLRVSLGAGDGKPMADQGNFSGPTNFWNIMESIGLKENESGEMRNRTWGSYLANCE